MSTLPDLGKRFQTLRRAAGKTQTQIAQIAGIRQEALSRFERGRSNDFSLGKMLRLLKALDMAIDFQAVTARPTLDRVLDERRSGANIGPDAR